MCLQNSLSVYLSLLAYIDMANIRVDLYPRAEGTEFRISNIPPSLPLYSSNWRHGFCPSLSPPTSSHWVVVIPFPPLVFSDPGVRIVSLRLALTWSLQKSVQLFWVCHVSCQDSLTDSVFSFFSIFFTSQTIMWSFNWW